jgi:hypothetical protein
MNRFRRELERGKDQLQPIVILDPHDIVSNLVSSSIGDHRTVRNWFELRKWWVEARHGAGWTQTDRTIRVVDSSIRAEDDVPPDILDGSRVVVIATHLTENLAAVLGDLPPELADDIIEQGMRDQACIEAIAHYFSLEVSPYPDLSVQLSNAMVLRLRTEVPHPVRQAILNTITDPVAAELASEKAPRAFQAEWEAWVTGGPAGGYTTAIEALGPSMAQLFATGVLTPVTASRQLPQWAQIGVASEGAGQRLQGLLDGIPDTEPRTLEEWLLVAEQLGEMRWLLATEGGLKEVKTEVVSKSTRMSGEFETWIRMHYGETLMRTAALPLVVPKINGFLRSRIQSGQAKKIALLVLDGMGMWQWIQIREEMGLTPLESSGLLAAIPTTTSISRQAIFSGLLPKEFAASISTTAKEGALWSHYWTTQAGLPSYEVNYQWTEGIEQIGQLDIGSYAVTGISAVAIDELGHSSSVYHDVQQAMGIRTWIDKGFLRGVIDEAARCGAELWVTSDHGNLKCTGFGVSNPGVLGERATTRVQLFNSRDARMASDAPGIDWDVASTLPDNVFPKFAAGTDAYTVSGHELLTHGSLSIDEVVVPLVRLN